MGSSRIRDIRISEVILSWALRKIRKFYAKFPELKDIAKFYVKFRRIIRDGERLQGLRKEYGEEKFLRRFARLEIRFYDSLEKA